MRKSVLVLLTATLAFASIQSIAIAAVKPGTTCKKVGQTSTSSGIKYTCVKSGKKLVWNKGVAVPKPTPTPTAIGDPIGAVGSTPTPTPTPTPTVKPVVENATAKKAFDIIQSARVQSPQLTFTYRIASFVSPDIGVAVKKYVENAARVYSLFLDSPRVVIIHVYTEKDLPALADDPMFFNRQDLLKFADWWKKDDAELNSSIGYPATYTNSSCLISVPTQCTGPAGHAGAFYPSRANTSTLDESNLAVPSHELFHVMQDFYRFNGKPQYAVTEEVKDLAMAPVFREGGAGFMGLSASYSDYTQYEKGFLFYKNWLAREYPNDFKALNSNEDVVSLLVKLERLDRSGRLYGVGTALHEWLIVNYGLDKFISLTKKHNVGKQFSEVFSETYGITLVEAYTKAAPHILERIKT
jgi:hypothetical protein